MFILKKGHQPGVYVPLRALFLVCSYFQFADAFFGGKNPLSYVLLIVCFVLAWIETWFLDFKVVPVERKARRSGEYNMSLVVRKPVFGVSDQVRHKPGCTATKDGMRLEISDLGSRGIVLFE